MTILIRYWLNDEGFLISGLHLIRILISMTEHNDAGKTRRDFLRLSAASALTAGFSSASIQRALALPADHSTGTIEDVQHIVVLMQENRSFDHYFGNLRGVRGHNDRF